MDSATSHRPIGWNAPAHMHSGLAYDEALNLAVQVLGGVEAAFCLKDTKATVLFGASFFATIEPRGRLFKIHYAKYPPLGRRVIARQVLQQGYAEMGTF